MQGIFPLSLAGSGVRLTTAKFYSPNGHPISHVGVQPDITVHRVAKPAQRRTRQLAGNAGRRRGPAMPAWTAARSQTASASRKAPSKSSAIDCCHP